VARGYVPTLVLLSAVWGATFIFVKVAVEELDPVVATGLQFAFAGTALAVLLGHRQGARGGALALRATGRSGIVLGLLNGAVPFLLLAWGEQRVSAGTAAIATSTVPIFTSLLAIRVRPSERAGGLRLVGIVVGLGGVAVLAGLQPEAGWEFAAGVLAVVAAAVCYSAANLFVQVRFAGASSLAVATVTALVAAAALLVPALLRLPDEAPSAKALGSTAALGIVATGLAWVVLFRAIGLYGAGRMSFTTYLIPAFALAYGALFLDEGVSAASIAGLALVLAGVGLGSGLMAPRRRPAALEPGTVEEPARSPGG
jgi:drug/metabolite transporter (DMT)-like permease